MEKIEIKQQRGPTIDFVGEMLARNTFQTSGNDLLEVVFEIWETQGGALIAVSSSCPINRRGRVVTNATVVEPQEDKQAMHFAVLDHFDWHDRARSMARGLKWKTRKKVA